MLNIYQIYYNEESMKGIERQFIPFNNTTPVKEKEFEYGVMRNLYLDGLLFNNKAKYAGVLSWKFRQKTGINDTIFTEWINKHKGYDVYFVNPWPEHSCMSFNSWYQGEYFHPGLIELTGKLFKKAGFDIDIRNIRNTFKTLCFCNYFVANKEFWDVYMSYCEKVYEAIYNTNEESKRLLFDVKADEYIDSAFFAFIMERMFPTVLALEELKILNYYDINSAKQKHPTLKIILDKVYPLIADIDKNKEYTQDNIELINSIGRLYHDRIFNKFTSYEDYVCSSIIKI